MSLTEIAAALIGLRETTYKDHQRLNGGLDEMRGSVDAARTAIDEVLDRRLAHAAQAFRDVERRLEAEYERRIESMLATMMEVAERLDTLCETARGSDDVAELQERLASLEGPRDRLQRLLDDAGIRSFNAEGEPYDPLRHEVVQRRHLADCTREYVLEELRPGFVREGTDHTLVRAKVIVAAPPVREGSEDAELRGE